MHVFISLNFLLMERFCNSVPKSRGGYGKHGYQKGQMLVKSTPHFPLDINYHDKENYSVETSL